MRKFSSALVVLIGVAFFASLLMGPVSSPTVKTSRLRVGTGLVPLANNLSVTGVTTLTGDLQATTGTFSGDVSMQNVTVNGVCTGCGLPAAVQFNIAFSDGCSNDPLYSVRFQRLVPGGIGVYIMDNDGSNVTCTSDGVEFQTAVGAVPVAQRPGFAIQTIQGNLLSVAGVQTPACMIWNTNGQVSFKTGSACATAPGNVAKVVTAGNTANFIMSPT